MCPDANQGYYAPNCPFFTPQRSLLYLEDMKCVSSSNVTARCADSARSLIDADVFATSCGDKPKKINMTLKKSMNNTEAHRRCVPHMLAAMGGGRSLHRPRNTASTSGTWYSAPSPTAFARHLHMLFFMADGPSGMQDEDDRNVSFWQHRTLSAYDALRAEIAGNVPAHSVQQVHPSVLYSHTSPSASQPCPNVLTLTSNGTCCLASDGASCLQELGGGELHMQNNMHAAARPAQFGPMCPVAQLAPERAHCTEEHNVEQLSSKRQGCGEASTAPLPPADDLPPYLRPLPPMTPFWLLPGYVRPDLRKEKREHHDDDAEDLPRSKRCCGPR